MSADTPMTDHQLCGAKTRSGAPCAKPPINGATRCRLHGGASPQAKAKAEERLAEAAAGRELTRLGVTYRNVHPAEALIELVSYQASIWRHKVSQLDDDALTWGRTKTKTGGDDAGTTEEAKPNIAYSLLGEASDRLAAYAAAALKAGVDERRVKVAEAQGAAVAGIQRSILDRMLTATIELLRAQGVGDDKIIDALRHGWADAMGVIVPQELRRLGEGNAA